MTQEILSHYCNVGSCFPQKEMVAVIVGNTKKKLLNLYVVIFIDRETLKLLINSIDIIDILSLLYLKGFYKNNDLYKKYIGCVCA